MVIGFSPSLFGETIAQPNVPTDAARVRRFNFGEAITARFPGSSNGSDEGHGRLAVFCDHLRDYRDGRLLRNVVGSQRGY
jgi:hypothetical protein